MELFSKQWNLKELKTKLRVKYPQLTETDLEHEEGKEESMFRMKEYKHSLTKTDMRLIIDEL